MLEGFLNTLANVVMTAAIVVIGVIATGVSIWARLGRYGPYSTAQEEQEALERQKYRAVDFGGVATSRAATQAAPAAARTMKPSPDAAPLTPLPLNSALAEAVADRRPVWAWAAEQGLVAVVSVCGVVLFLVFVILDGNGYRSDAGAPEAVAELLEMNGFAAPKVERRMLAIHCYQSFAYRWTAMGAQGRACVNYYDGEIEVKIDRTWVRAPPPMS